MSAMSELHQMMQTTEVKKVDYFPNGRGRRWLVIYREGDHTWSIGLIEKPNNTATETQPYAVYAYDPPVKGDMSDPDWVGDYPGDSLKLLDHHWLVIRPLAQALARHDKVNNDLDCDWRPHNPMVQSVVIHMSGVNPPVS